MIHLYLDTNAYLSFYHFTSDDLEELKKLLVVIRGGKITLHLPDQTNDEFRRNREAKIADAIRALEEQKLNEKFPRICRDFPQFRTMQEAKAEFERAKDQLIIDLKTKVNATDLAPDRLVFDLFAVAKRYETSENTILKAKTRFDLGRPPGKNKSYGDAINWEILLEKVPPGETLHFVSDDRDFFSKINSNDLNPYLKDEWFILKNSQIQVHRRISEFFSSNFPNIKIASEFEKDDIIQKLAGSSSFAASRGNLNRLVLFEQFSPDQLNEIIRACCENNQIYWIRGDEDIVQMLSKIIEPNREKIDDKMLKQYDEMYSENKASDDDDLFF